MIRDLSETLKGILQDPSVPPELAAADILFDRPSDPFTLTKTTMDLFLYDVRENTELRSNEHVVERRNNQSIIHPAPLRLNCSYLVTAWPVGGPRTRFAGASVADASAACPGPVSNHSGEISAR
jgi:hypothetical protein